MQKRDLKEDIGFHHDKDEAMASLKQVQGFRGEGSCWRDSNGNR